MRKLDRVPWASGSHDFSMASLPLSVTSRKFKLTHYRAV